MFRKIISVLCVCLISIAGFAIDFPALTGQVVDEAHILSETTKQQILSTMKPNQQFVVVTLKSLRGYEIEDYSVVLGRHWGIGSREKNDGLLLVVAPKERQVRIEVGYGLEDIVTDAKAKEIIENIILPAFIKGDYNQGIWEGFSALQNLIAGKQIYIESKDPMGAVICGILFLSVFHWIGIYFLFHIYLELQKRVKKFKRQPAVHMWRFVSFIVLCFLLAHVVWWGSIVYRMFQTQNAFMAEGFWGAWIIFLYGFVFIGLAQEEKESSSVGLGYSTSDSSWSDSSSSSDSSSYSGGGGSFGGGGASGRW